MKDKTKARMIKHLRNDVCELSELVKDFGLSAGAVRGIVKTLKRERVSISERMENGKTFYHIRVLPDSGNVYRISEATDETVIMRFAVAADFHMGNKFHLSGTWHDAMRITEDAGIKTVYVSGDVLDGQNVYHGQLENLCAFGVEGQTDLAAEAISKHPRLRFKAISGNHDYSFTKLNGVKPLAVLEQKVKNFKNCGDLRADVIQNGVRMRMIHGASGRSYARSYPSQTYLRDYFTGLDKRQFVDVPDMMFLGHYHTMYQGKDHGIFVLQPGSFQDSENEYCIRRGLTGPIGLWHIKMTVKSGVILDLSTKYVQPEVSYGELGRTHAGETRNYN